MNMVKIGRQSPIGRRCWYTNYPHVAGTVLGSRDAVDLLVEWDDMPGETYASLDALTIDWITPAVTIDSEPPF